MILFISFEESFFIIFVAILLFGVDQIPEIAMVLGKSIYKIRYSINKIKKEMWEYYEKEEFSKKLKKEKKELDDNFSGSIKRT
ncbi:MAG: twin-arginine translocase TatA/TatE family subunit [Candidatus Bostrichicola ureolyticus]|nr:MAG: twin-arginine translocase TatA/TatE family subunit [Candidatus Bostrichicola ureolyticus]WGH27897.1 MAG: twin-arginine translocase TatA/TatE family subunit [Candidatus Bostrichicola ureolyticus]